MTKGTTIQPAAIFLLRAVLMSILATIHATAGSAQTPCASLVAQGIAEYEAGRLDEALARVRQCLTDGSSLDERRDAYALVAKIHVARDDLDAAREAVEELLGVDPNFAASAVSDPPRFVSLVDRLKRERARVDVSSVSKINESLFEAPATVVVLTRDQITQRGYLDLEAVLHDLPGFSISRTNGLTYSNIYQRGYRSDATTRTLFLVDGVEQNDLFSNIVYLSRQYPLSNVDRIEVIYGPASTMYGANAFLGVINVITRQPEDLIGSGLNAGADVQIGSGAWGTHVLDGTAAGRFRNATFSLTGRLYRSDEWDLSAYPSWSYRPDSYDQARRRYEAGLLGGTVGEFFSDWDLLTPAIERDRKALGGTLLGRAIGYSDLTDDWVVSGRLNAQNLKLGFQAWRQREGRASWGTDTSVPGARNGNIWAPYQTAIYGRYTGSFSRNLSFSFFGQAKVHGLGTESSEFILQSYLNGPLTVLDLEPFSGKLTDPFWVHNRVIQSSSQFRNELNLVYQRGTTLSAVGGVEIRNGSIQRDYSRTTNCEPRDWLADRGLANVRDDQLLDETRARQYLLDVLLFERVFFLLDPRARPFVTPCLRAGSDGDRHPLAPDLPDQVAGEHFAVRDLGVFAQASYRPARQLKLIGGWRLDNNRISPNGGFGTVFSPRLGLVYSPAGLVLRAVYSEAFQDASSFEKFSTVPGLRDKANPALQPERAKNFELSAGRQWGRLSADLAVYRATYSSTVGLQPTNLAEDPDVGAFIQALHDLGIRNIVDWLDLYLDDDPLKGDRTLRQVLADRAPGAIGKIFKDPLLTFQFQNGGTLRVWGAQSTASWRYGSLDLFGNYTYTNPMNTSRSDAAGSLLFVRVGDIAAHQANVGVNVPVGRFNTNVRLNYVGARPTGKGTSVDRNPLSEIESYAVAHATLSYILRPGLTAQVIVNNLFDAEYFDPGVGPADGAQFAASIPQPRRAAFVRLLTSF